VNALKYYGLAMGEKKADNAEERRRKLEADLKEVGEDIEKLKRRREEERGGRP